MNQVQAYYCKSKQLNVSIYNRFCSKTSYSPQNILFSFRINWCLAYFSIHSMNFERSEIVTEWVTTSNYRANIGSHSKEILKTARCAWNFRDLLEVNGNIVLVFSKRVGDLPVVVVANFFDDCQSESEGIRRLALFFKSFKQGWGI